MTRTALGAEGAACRSILTSEQAGKGDLVAQNLRLGPDQVSFDLLAGEKTLPVRVGIPGLFTAYNALTVLGLAQALGLPLEQSAEALGRVQGVKGRIEVVPTPGTDFTVLIDYAHTPDGLENILRSARGFARGRVVAVFGCGGDRDRAKAAGDGAHRRGAVRLGGFYLRQPPAPNIPWPFCWRFWQAPPEAKRPGWRWKTAGQPFALHWITAGREM